MKKFSRTVEKVLAWIANIFLILITYALSSVFFDAEFKQTLSSQEFKTSFKDTLLQSKQQYNLTEYEINQIIDGMLYVVPIVTGVYIFVALVAIIISFTMKKRIFSGIMFLILAIATFVITVGLGFVIYIPYFVVAIMLFVRKPPVNIEGLHNINNTDEVEKIEYV